MIDSIRMVRRVATATLCAALLAGGSRTALAQSATIRGTVVDSSTQAPVPAVNVRLAEIHRADITHEDGSFVFERLAPGTYTIITQRIGFRPRTVRVEATAGTSTVRIEIVQTPIQLTPSVVTGTLSERRHDEVLSPTAVLTGAELDRRLDGTIAGTVRNVPGVAVTSIGPATGRPVIRGLGGDRVLILEDGQRPGDMSSTSGDHAVAIDPLTARQMEVVRGPMSLMYGSSALGGVVNVVRDEIPTSLTDRMHGTLSAQGNSVNTGGTLGGYVTDAVGSIALRAEGSARMGGDVRSPMGRLVNTDVQSYGASVGASKIGERGLIGAAYRFYSNDYGIPGGFVGGHESGVDIQMRRHTARAEGDLHLDRGVLDNVHAIVTATDYNHVELESRGVVGTRFEQQMYTAEVVARHRPRGAFAQGAVGTRLQSRSITTGGSLRSPSTDDFSAALFAVEEVGTGALRLQGGARWDWARYTPRVASFVNVGGEQIPVRDRTFGAVSGSLGLLYVRENGLRLGASASRAFRTPDFNELYSDGPHLAANSYDVGDPSLGQETGLGFDVFARLTKDHGEAEIAVFDNRMSNYIFPSSRGRAEIGGQGGRPRFQFTNEDAELRGVEGRVQWNLIHRVVGEGTFSYVQARFTSGRSAIPVIQGTDTSFVAASLYPPFIPPLNGRVGLRWDLPQFTITLGTRLAAEQTRTGDFEDPTAGYAVVDFSLGYRFVQGGRLHSVMLRMDNALDREYRDHLSRIKAIMPEPGRDISILYRLVF